MDVGALARDDGALIFSAEEADTLIQNHPQAKGMIRKYYGARELVNGSPRYCLWINEEELSVAETIPEISERLEHVRTFRAKSTAAVTRESANTPYRFGQITGKGVPNQQSILVPRTSSERRVYLPIDMMGADSVASADCQIIFDPPIWCFAVLASRLHLIWTTTVTGRLEGRIRYSSTLCWHAFPIPSFTKDQKDALQNSARKILKVRYSHHPQTIADLYNPDKIPDDLRDVHRENDDLLESMYIGRSFKNDTERLEKLFKLYAARIEKEAA